MDNAEMKEIREIALELSARPPGKSVPSAAIWSRMEAMPYGPPEGGAYAEVSRADLRPAAAPPGRGRSASS